MAGFFDLLSFFGLSKPVIEPEDNDAKNNDGTDLTVTATTDCDGATIRPAHVYYSQSFDNGFESALTTSIRGDMDRRLVRFATRLPNKGYTPRFAFESLRAGEAFGLRSVQITAHATPFTKREATNTTGATDANGATMRVPSLHLAHATDDSRNSALTWGATDQDRFSVRHAVHSNVAAGFTHCFAVETDGQAGDVLALLEMRIEGAEDGETPTREKLT